MANCLLVLGELILGTEDHSTASNRTAVACQLGCLFHVIMIIQVLPLQTAVDLPHVLFFITLRSEDIVEASLLRTLLKPP